VKGSDGQLHLLKRIIPVAKESMEPKGRLTQPKQYLHDTLRDFAEEIHSELLGHPQRMVDLSHSVDPRLKAKKQRVKTREFVKKFPDLFSTRGEKANEVVHALVVSKQSANKHNKPPPISVVPAHAPAEVPHAVAVARAEAEEAKPGRKTGAYFKALRAIYGNYENKL
jgi:hypothetical protein